MKYVIGIDPGVSGAVAILSLDKEKVMYYPFSKYTEHELCCIMKTADNAGAYMCHLEKVHSMPKQGVSSVFTFGKNFGWYIGMLDALQISYDFITPQRWQQSMSCRSGGDKNVTKRRAQQLFPKIKVTHAIADALLIAENLRRNEAASGDNIANLLV